MFFILNSKPHGLNCSENELNIIIFFTALRQGTFSFELHISTGGISACRATFVPHDGYLWNKISN